MQLQLLAVRRGRQSDRSAATANNIRHRFSRDPLQGRLASRKPQSRFLPAFLLTTFYKLSSAVHFSSRTNTHINYNGKLVTRVGLTIASCHRGQVLMIVLTSVVLAQTDTQMVSRSHLAIMSIQHSVLTAILSALFFQLTWVSFSTS